MAIRRSMVADLAAHLEHELSRVLRNHVAAMMVELSPTEGKGAIVAAIATLSMEAYVAAALLDPRGDVSAAFDEICAAMPELIGSQRESLLARAEQVRAAVVAQHGGAR